MHRKILVVTDNLKTQINGVVTTFKNLEKHALKDDYEIVYLDPSYFKHIAAPGYPEVKLSLPLGIGKIIEEINPDYIHIATEGPIGFAARIYCDYKKYRYNTSYHTKFPEFIKKIYHVPEFLTYVYLRWFHKHSGIVLTNTQSMVSLLERKKFKANVDCWTRGVDRTELKATVDDIQNCSVIYVGRVSKEKGLDDLCELQDKFKIIIVGDGPYRKDLELRYKKVEFVGYKTGNELANYYRRASVFCFPSKSDTFGIVIIEAMSLGCPVAAYPVTGPVDIIENNVTGVLSLDLETAIRQCFDLDRELIENKSKEWTWERCWEQFRDKLVESTLYWIQNRDSNINSINYGNPLSTPKPIELSITQIKNFVKSSLIEIIKFYLPNQNYQFRLYL
jgi:glycosyltransferase involved in cell wall biosynthesis